MSVSGAPLLKRLIFDTTITLLYAALLSTTLLSWRCVDAFFCYQPPSRKHHGRSRPRVTSTTDTCRNVHWHSLSTGLSSAAAEEEQALLSILPLSTEAHALEVIQKFASKTSGSTTTTIATAMDLFRILCSLDVEATEEEAAVLFRFLDEDGDGEIDYEDFLPWYLDAAAAAAAVAESFQSLLVGRRTIEEFDLTPVSNDVLRRAVQCAVAAPNRSCSEPWRFIQVGPQTVAKVAQLNIKLRKTMETEDGTSSVLDWTKVPGWCVVTTRIRPGDLETEQEDFKSVCCAIQNFMLSMWSEGVGTKWTSGPVQKTQDFADMLGVDTSTERVVGCIWYGYATGGAKYADPRRRKKTVEDVLCSLP